MNMKHNNVAVEFTTEELSTLLSQAQLDPVTRKLVDSLLQAVEPVMVTSVDGLDALPVETAIRMGSNGRVRTRVKSVNGKWVGAGADGPSSLTSDQVLYWYTRVEVLHVGTGWNP